MEYSFPKLPIMYPAMIFATPVTMLKSPIAVPIIFLSTKSATYETEIICEEDLCIPQKKTANNPNKGF